ncbi:tetrathionate respiration response regulator TtrR [Serratia proteamaculans]|uniref:tetrathionate respiration response regulator TtrR n=1 Tax=Serratia proteamaculans TaxID=28151 RepID=UPI002179796F|nr:tetrathionate respiration response regulator TtrR [Serratia proteamaculans]CAI0988851.1 Transcriptional regulatory protein fixJ [Serratia proteamaculans]CAI1073431.1 Transcriptional regulatory protein fixJ [Serratia proteamaculans]
MALIHLVDDDLAVTDACRFLLEGLNYRVQIWHDSQKFVDQVSLYQCGVVMLDIRMPGMDGQQVHQQLRRQGSTLAVVIVTGHGDIAMAVTEMKLGAVDFLQKPIAAAPLIEALDRGIAHSQYRLERHQLQQRFSALTPREREIARAVAAGMTNTLIADRHFIAVRTVEVHRARVMEKMQAASLAELVNSLNQLTLTEPPESGISRL